MNLPSLLLLDAATITTDGIHFNGIFYTCSLAVKEQWFLPSESNEDRKIAICFDPKNPNFLLLLIDHVGVVPAYKVMDAKQLNPDALEAYHSAINVLKRSRRKLKRRKNKKRGVHA